MYNVAAPSYGTRPLVAEQPHPLFVDPAGQTSTFNNIYNKTLGGSMVAVPYAFQMLANSGRRLNPTQRAMANTFNTVLSTPRGSPQYLQALSRASNAWRPDQYMRQLQAAGMGQVFRPENFGYFAERASSDDRLSDWRTSGSSAYMLREANRRGLAPWQFLGGMPAFEWNRYRRAAELGLQRLGNESYLASQVVDAPQIRNIVDAVGEMLRGHGGSMESLLSTLIGNLNLDDLSSYVNK